MDRRLKDIYISILKTADYLTLTCRLFVAFEGSEWLSWLYPPVQNSLCVGCPKGSLCTVIRLIHLFTVHSYLEPYLVFTQLGLYSFLWLILLLLSHTRVLGGCSLFPLAAYSVRLLSYISWCVGLTLSSPNVAEYVLSMKQRDMMPNNAPCYWPYSTVHTYPFT